MDKSKWEYKKLGEVCEVLDKFRKPVTKSDRVAGQYPYYGATGIQDYVADYIFDGRYLLLGEDGAKWGANENSAFIIEGKSWVNNHAHILKIDDSFMDIFVMYYLNHKDLSEYITGAVVPKLTQAAMHGLQFVGCMIVYLLIPLSKKALTCQPFMMAQVSLSTARLS